MFIISPLKSYSVTSIEICKLFPYRKNKKFTSIWINLVSKYGNPGDYPWSHTDHIKQEPGMDCFVINQGLMTHCLDEKLTL